MTVDCAQAKDMYVDLRQVGPRTFMEWDKKIGNEKHY